VTGWYSSIDYCTQFGCATSWHDWFSWSNATHPCADDATQCCIDAGVMHTLPASGVMEVRTAASLAGAVPGERSLPTFTTYLGAN
jgi:hypothetical protein